jgi:type IV pilus assembly protein PilQ
MAESNNQESYAISALTWEQTENDFVLTIKGDTPPTYTMYELFNPFRVIIDIADASIDPSLDMSANLPQGPVSQIKGQVLEDKEPFIARIEFFLSEDNSYTIDRLDNDIVVRFAKSKTVDQTENAETDPPVETTAIDIEPPASAMPASPASPAMTADSEPIAPEGAATHQATVLFGIEVEHLPTETKVFLKADGPIMDFTKEHLAANTKANLPDRMYIDVKKVKLAGPIQPQTVGTALAQIRTGARTDGFRVVFDSGLAGLFDYEVSEQDDGLLVTIKEPSAATSVIAGLVDAENVTDSSPEVIPEAQTIEPLTDEEEIIATGKPRPTTESDKSAPIVTPHEQPQTETGAALAFAGYTKRRITVDFYKIDLHNVFRLFGEISNLNMVVDSAVSGSLTLALNDVPWDFALDIILNLKDLQKEERFNTIVISPKSKKFEWPERTTLETVEFKADESFDIAQQEQEGIKISKLQDIPETVVEAKNLIHQAQESEKLGNYTAALALYEEAFAKWPENTIIAKRITALCLVHLGQNAKAVHYAKAVLKADPNAYDSALQAAIGLARMKKTDQAEEYFEKSVSGPLPSSAALTSYAAFAEELQQLDKALALLKRHEDLHGDSLETMISKARIHDKQNQRELASSEYQAILLSGYEIPPDLARYIKGRASLVTE